MGVENGIATVLPANCPRKMEKESHIVPGTHEKGEIVKKIAKMLDVHPDGVQNLLPAGRISIVK